MEVEEQTQSRPVVNEDGQKLYLIILDEEVARNESSQGELPARNSMAAENARDIYGWHKPNVRALVKRFEREYGIKAQTMTSYTLPSFSAFLSDEVAQEVSADPRVVRMVMTYDDSVVFSAWADGGSQNTEIIPWGKIAIGTNDNLTTGNVVYMVDGGAISNSTELSGVVNAPVNGNYSDSWAPHAYHVAGILSANKNNTLVRGVNPGSQVMNIRTHYWDYGSILNGIDWALYNAEEYGRHGVLNISMNGRDEDFDTGLFGASDPIGNFLLRASSRLLIVQSAGNHGADACDYAFNYPGGLSKANDGILVVGGIQENGGWMNVVDNRHLYDYPGDPNRGLEPGSNYGPCVEVWAPGKNIWSTFKYTAGTDWAPGLPADKARLSGTSMAAPHVAALAARYGNVNTTPVEREYFIRSKLLDTLATDPVGLPIRVPSFTQQSGVTLPKRLAISSISADNSTPGSSPYYVNDGLYLSPLQWNAGHPAPGWIEFDLGSSKKVVSIRLVPEQTPSGQVEHIVYAGNSPAPSLQVGKYKGYGATLEPILVELNSSKTARYVRVYTKTNQSNVAWREVELYGY